MTVLPYAGLHLMSCQEIVNTQNRSVILVLIYVMHVLKSVKNISEWSTVNYVHKHVVNALKSVVEWQGSE